METIKTITITTPTPLPFAVLAKLGESQSSPEPATSESKYFLFLGQASLIIEDRIVADSYLGHLGS